MATQSEVNTYLSNISQELTEYGNRMATMHQQGNKPDFPKEIKFELLQSYVEIAKGYLEKWNSSTDDNYMTVAEFEEIMKHINTITNSSYWLDLN